MILAISFNKKLCFSRQVGTCRHGKRGYKPEMRPRRCKDGAEMGKKLSEMSLEELWALFPINLTAHQDCWAEWYAEEADALRKLLPGGHGLRIHHIGSTAIPGIWAKPVIDILLEAPAPDAMRAAGERLVAGGWICMSDTGERISLNKGYTEAGLEERVFHLHLRLPGDYGEIRFRDYLRAHPEAAKAYERLKLSLWKTCGHNRDRYTAGKTGFVTKYTRLAEAEASRRYAACKEAEQEGKKEIAMTAVILKGTVVSALPQGLEITENGYLAAEDGRVTGVFQTLPERYAGAPVEDFGQALIVQSFCDMHLHAPQYPMLGMGMDLPLLNWLDTYAFPTESRFSDPAYARRIYRQLARELVENGTTRVCMFSSLHREATLVLMEELEKAGVTGYVGKVNMDRNGGTDLQETTEESLRETLCWLEECQGFPHIKPILTPRFTPSCTDGLMAFLGRTAAERNLPIQSHLSENTGELKWVAELHPDCRQYWQTYAKFGLWNSRTLMAHCVWSDEAERRAMAEAGVTAVHCPDSNQNLCSGVAPVRSMLREGVKVTLGSDIAGGDRLPMLDVMAAAIRASKARRVLDQWQTDFLTVPEAWYLGTSAGAAFFGEQPGFAPGNALHAVVLADEALPRARTPQERLERCLYRRQKGAIRAVWSEGRKVYSAP